MGPPGRFFDAALDGAGLGWRLAPGAAWLLVFRMRHVAGALLGERDADWPREESPGPRDLCCLLVWA